MTIRKFTFNSFQENTFVLSDDTAECVIFDPGCSTPQEENELKSYIEELNLTPVRLINTHCHIDHVLGNKFVSDVWQLPLEAHAGEVPVLESGLQVSQMYGIAYTPSPPIAKYIEAGDEIKFGNSSLQTYFTPGHSPASLSFLHEESKNLIAGDVLFYGSIGRTDLPGGNFDTLIKSIKEQLFPLGDDVIVHPGHGPSTSIGFEKENNPFLQ